MSGSASASFGSASIRLEVLIAALSKAVGEDKARAAVMQAATELGYLGPELSRDAALSILETVAEAGGLVGVTARFARTRLLLPSSASFLDGKDP
jgi:hypothetical protein